MYDKEKVNEVKKLIRSEGIQDLTDIQVLDSLSTGNELLKLEGVPPIDFGEEEIIWSAALVVAVMKSIDGNFQNEWIKATTKLIGIGND